jgi:hypothetical protein
LDLDLDDDFMGEIEFDLSQDQGRNVQRAIEIASSSKADDFARINPLLTIMAWWEANTPDDQKFQGTPEDTLAEACRRYVLAHQDA